MRMTRRIRGELCKVGLWKEGMLDEGFQRE